jgi:hypothetical protein
MLFLAVMSDSTLEEETRNCPPQWRPHMQSVLFTEEVLQVSVSLVIGRMN